MANEKSKQDVPATQQPVVVNVLPPAPQELPTPTVGLNETIPGGKYLLEDGKTHVNCEGGKPGDYNPPRD